MPPSSSRLVPTPIRSNPVRMQSKGGGGTHPPHCALLLRMQSERGYGMLPSILARPDPTRPGLFPALQPVAALDPRNPPDSRAISAPKSHFAFAGRGHPGLHRRPHPCRPLSWFGSIQLPNAVKGAVKGAVLFAAFLFLGCNSNADMARVRPLSRNPELRDLGFCLGSRTATAPRTRPTPDSRAISAFGLRFAFSSRARPGSRCRPRPMSASSFGAAVRTVPVPDPLCLSALGRVPFFFTALFFLERNPNADMARVCPSPHNLELRDLGFCPGSRTAADS